jgi:hypothetical protein
MSVFFDRIRGRIRGLLDTHQRNEVEQWSREVLPELKDLEAFSAAGSANAVAIGFCVTFERPSRFIDQIAITAYETLVNLASATENVSRMSCDFHVVDFAMEAVFFFPEDVDRDFDQPFCSPSTDRHLCKVESVPKFSREASRES